jgi:hypothetical protein
MAESDLKPGDNPATISDETNRSQCRTVNLPSLDSAACMVKTLIQARHR